MILRNVGNYLPNDILEDWNLSVTAVRTSNLVGLFFTNCKTQHTACFGVLFYAAGSPLLEKVQNVFSYWLQMNFESFPNNWYTQCHCRLTSYFIIVMCKCYLLTELLCIYKSLCRVKLLVNGSICRNRVPLVWDPTSLWCWWIRFCSQTCKTANRVPKMDEACSDTGFLIVTDFYKWQNLLRPHCCLQYHVNWCMKMCFLPVFVLNSCNEIFKECRDLMGYKFKFSTEATFYSRTHL
jgi:hypothetical protein